MDMYKKIKKQNGERFAQAIRNYHNGIFEIPELDKILRHAGRDAEPLLPYLTNLLYSNVEAKVEQKPEDPFVLLDKAGYEAFYADTLEKQNSIKKYFAKGELLCTFGDNSRYKNYHIVHAVKKDVDKIKRKDFKGKEKRQDEYGTSVISIQMLKKGGFISIKNRYNHTVANCDNTFNSNPDNIIDGLSQSLKDHFNVDFNIESPVPDGFVLINGQIFKYHQEINGTYYGDNAWVKDGEISVVDKSKGDILLGYFLFDGKSSTLKKIDPDLQDSFADDFNRDYGGRKGLAVKNGKLVLDGEILITTENSKVTTINLPELTTMSDNCLKYAHNLTEFRADNLTQMGNYCFHEAKNLTKFEANNLTKMGSYCFYRAVNLTKFEANNLTKMGNDCFYKAKNLTKFEANNLTKMGHYCFCKAVKLTKFEANNLTEMGNYCFENAPNSTKPKIFNNKKTSNFFIRLFKRNMF